MVGRRPLEVCNIIQGFVIFHEVLEYQSCIISPQILSSYLPESVTHLEIGMVKLKLFRI